ncbi:MAG TPA: D-alanyl-D-alanine carboxypeptidase, partial [Chitinophagaceae bacterium]|nr:D-alanyl-D-alanine carboxypeptidase [Chitinophagaceae bacterium]
MMNEKGQAWHYYKQFSFIILYSAFIIFLASCSVSKQISRSANENVLKNKALQTAHVGISIYDPLDNKYLYNYQGDKYFVPASNTKIPTCYAAMKYLGDSLVGLKYGLSDGEDSSYTVLAI